MFTRPLILAAAVLSLSALAPLAHAGPARQSGRGCTDWQVKEADWGPWIPNDDLKIEYRKAVITSTVNTSKFYTMLVVRNMNEFPVDVRINYSAQGTPKGSRTVTLKGDGRCEQLVVDGPLNLMSIVRESTPGRPGRREATQGTPLTDMTPKKTTTSPKPSPTIAALEEKIATLEKEIGELRLEAGEGGGASPGRRDQINHELSSKRAELDKLKNQLRELKKQQQVPAPNTRPKRTGN